MSERLGVKQSVLIVHFFMVFVCMHTLPINSSWTPLFSRPRHWGGRSTTLTFAEQMVGIVVHCKSIEIKNAGGRLEGIGPWEH
jgi:hypothetical protein